MIVCEPIHFTPTEQRMLGVLSDYQLHSREELRTSLYDELGALDNIRQHIMELRRKLRPGGQVIICELHDGEPFYRLAPLSEIKSGCKS